jgi:hypothetical protein
MKFIGLREKLGDTGYWNIKAARVMEGTCRDVISTCRLLIIALLLLLLCCLVIVNKNWGIIYEIYWVKGKVGRCQLLKNGKAAEMMGWKLQWNGGDGWNT